MEIYLHTTYNRTLIKILKRRGETYINASFFLLFFMGSNVPEEMAFNVRIALHLISYFLWFEYICKRYNLALRSRYLLCFWWLLILRKSFFQFLQKFSLFTQQYDEADLNKKSCSSLKNTTAWKVIPYSFKIILN